jgi:hypothetical protein
MATITVLTMTGIITIAVTDCGRYDLHACKEAALSFPEHATPPSQSMHQLRSAPK